MLGVKKQAIMTCICSEGGQQCEINRVKCVTMKFGPLIQNLVTLMLLRLASHIFLLITHVPSKRPIFKTCGENYDNINRVMIDGRGKLHPSTWT